MNPVGKEAEYRVEKREKYIYKKKKGFQNLKKEKRNFSIGHNRKTLTDDALYGGNGEKEGIHIFYFKKVSLLFTRAHSQLRTIECLRSSAKDDHVNTRVITRERHCARPVWKMQEGLGINQYHSRWRHTVRRHSTPPHSHEKMKGGETWVIVKTNASMEREREREKASTLTIIKKGWEASGGVH